MAFKPSEPDKGVTCLEVQDGVVIAPTFIGIFHSNDGGLSWHIQDTEADRSKINDCAFQLVYDKPTSWIITDPTNENIMIRFTRGNNIERSNDKGETWVIEYSIAVFQAKEEQTRLDLGAEKLLTIQYFNENEFISKKLSVLKDD